MKSISIMIRRITLMAFIACMFRCAKDYNPFENVANVQAYIAPESCSQRVRDNDTLLIFTTETLAVNTTVREKIDSIKFHADNNRLQNDIILTPPFSADVIKFLFSFSDTGSHAVAVTAFRSDKSTSSVGPLTFHVKSPLKQNDIDTVLGASLMLSTPPVGDDDVYYWWSFGTSPNDTEPASTIPHIEFPPPSNLEIGKKMTGYLWVTDTSGKQASPASTFSFLFYRPAAPVIVCTNKGLFGDSVVVNNDTLVFSVQVIDSSGVGLKLVEIAGMPVVSSGNLIFSEAFTGMKAYTATNPKQVRVMAVNNVNDTAIQTYYCYFETTGPRPDLVKLTLVNPKSSLTTSQSSVYDVVTVNKYTQDTVNVRTLLNGQLVKTQPVTDSVKTLFNSVTLIAAIDTIRTQAWIHGEKYADTSIVVTQDPSYVDKTPPEIILITINGKIYTPNTTFSLAATDTSFIVTVTAFDNESGIDSVKLEENLLLNKTKSILMTYSIALYSYYSSSIPYVAAGTAISRQMTLTLTVKNNANLSTAPVTITVTKK